MNNLQNLYSAYYSTPDPFGIFKHTEAVHHPDQLSIDGTLILWGGEDISPGIYHQLPVHTHAPKQPSRRDTIEIALANRAIKLGIPIIGVCRGAQLMCALNGGTLYQHIEGGHHGSHKVKTKDGHVFVSSSCHHQALRLKDTEHEVLATEIGKTKGYTDIAEELFTVPEVVWFPKTKTLAIQGHPEWMNQTDDFVKWCSELFLTKLGIV